MSFYGTYFLCHFFEYLHHNNYFIAAKKPVDTEECNIHDNSFLCHDQMKCIELKEVCNNHPDCDDGSDEGGMCLDSNKTGNQTLFKLVFMRISVCT